MDKIREAFWVSVYMSLCCTVVALIIGLVGLTFAVHWSFGLLFPVLFFFGYLAIEWSIEKS